ncbi:hypothetical protein Tco_1568563 [Tanacetum coccineum]
MNSTMDEASQLDTVANFTLQSISIVATREKLSDSVRSNQQMRLTTPSVPLKLTAFAMVAACTSRAVATLSATSTMLDSHIDARFKEGKFTTSF